MDYRFSGKSGLQLPLVSLGLWHNFGSEDPADVARAMLLHAWENGSSVKQLDDNLQAISNIQFTAEEMELIKTIG